MSQQQQRRGSITAAAAGFTAFVNIYALQSLLPILAQVFQADSRQVSMAVSATALAVALSAPFAGWLIRRWNRAQVIKVSVAGLVIAGLNVAAASSLTSLIAWRFVQGLFLPILVAGVLSFMALDFPREQLGRATSNYVTWTIVGGFSGRWVGGLVAGAMGWRWALLVLALLNAAAGLLLLASLRNPESRLPSGPDPRPLAALVTLKRSDLRCAYLVGFGSLFTLVGLFTYVTFHLSRAPYNLGPEALGRTFCVYLVGITITPMVGRVLGRWGVALTVRRATAAAMLGLILTLLPHLGGVILGLSLACGAAFATQAAVSSFIARLEPEVKAGAAGLYLSFYYFGGSLGALIPSWAWEWAGWPGCVLLLVGVQAALRRVCRGIPATPGE